SRPLRILVKILTLVSSMNLLPWARRLPSRRWGFFGVGRLDAFFFRGVARLTVYSTNIRTVPSEPAAPVPPPSTPAPPEPPLAVIVPAPDMRTAATVTIPPPPPPAPPNAVGSIPPPETAAGGLHPFASIEPAFTIRRA